MATNEHQTHDLFHPTCERCHEEMFGSVEEAGTETLRGLWDEAFELEKKLYSERGADEDRPAPDAPDQEQYAWEREGMVHARRESMCNVAMLESFYARAMVEKLEASMKRLDEAAACYGNDDNWTERIKATVVAEVTKRIHPTTD